MKISNEIQIRIDFISVSISKSTLDNKLLCPCLWYRFNGTFQWLKTLSYLLMSFCHFVFKMGFFRSSSNNWLEAFWKIYIIHKKTPVLESWKLKACNFMKKRLHRCFTVNIEKFLRKYFYWNIPVDCSKVDAQESYRKCKSNFPFSWIFR